ncbi:hypothetical protein UABAM_03994 [Candidatus Uabimicrobium amorphum]|uniref:Calpastatin n=2 Tax=Uabimicrobium amorphum TaxID=2596890 RepID=A0A5S9IR42_UABAM|nr:DUF1810 domain-containing protein [Candidatus Uabimicrobium amorphum]BBM85620.1 hypothetical protein UABAM_03994 [Candidatus Uabimicrobium amorphum]
MMDDTFHLQRFITAQESVYTRVVKELKNGRKDSHWMWYIFPQIDGLGFSATTKRYSIKSVAEAKAYLAHPILGQRLCECVELILAVEGKSVLQIMGAPDDLKLCSSMTLFSQMSDNPIFSQILEKYFAGKLDTRTLEILQNLKEE